METTSNRLNTYFADLIRCHQFWETRQENLHAAMAGVHADRKWLKTDCSKPAEEQQDGEKVEETPIKTIIYISKLNVIKWQPLFPNLMPPDLTGGGWGDRYLLDVFLGKSAIQCSAH